MTNIPVRILYSIKDDSLKSRSWREFESEMAMAYELVDYYEEYLRTIAPVPGELKEYSSNDMDAFLDDFFGELVCLIKDREVPTESDLWIPYGLAKIKESLYNYFRSTLEEQPTSMASAADLMLVEQVPPPLSNNLLTTCNNNINHNNLPVSSSIFAEGNLSRIHDKSADEVDLDDDFNQLDYSEDDENDNRFHQSSAQPMEV